MTKRMGFGAADRRSLRCLALPGRGAWLRAAGSAIDTVKGELDITWVMVACVLVLFMQAGFLLLEIGFSRQKNVGAGVAKVLVNLGDRDARLVGGRLRDLVADREQDLRHRGLLLPQRPGDRRRRRSAAPRRR